MSAKKIVLSIVIISVVFFLTRLAKDGGVLRTIKPLDWGKCESITGVIGAEDISVDRINKIAYIGADDRRNFLALGDYSNVENGGLWTLDLTDPNSQPKKLVTDFEGVLHPHGISLLMGENGVKEVYVVNHISTTQHEIDVFTVVSRDELKLRRRIVFDEMISPNDLVVVDKDRFFMTNDHGSPRGSYMEKVEDYLGLARSNVVYFDGEKAEIVIEGVKMANGIQLDKMAENLYLAESTGRRVTRFKRGDSLKDWQRHSSVNVQSAVDNLEWDGESHLLVAAHPKAFDFLAHVKNGQILSPSEVIRIDVSNDKMSAETLYLNMGEALSGASVATKLGKTLLIGTVFEPHFLRCVQP